MKTQVQWKEGMHFSGICDQNQVSMDAKVPLGKAQGFTPKELIAIGVSGCTAMDVIALLKKYKQDVLSLDVDADVSGTKGTYPEVFDKIHLQFRAKGSIEAESLMKAVQLSQTKYCGVSAMLAKAVPISYDVFLNNQNIGSGLANFETKNGDSL